MEARQVFGGGAALGQAVDDLDEELVKFLAGDRTDFEAGAETADEEIGDFVRDGGFGDVKGLVDVK